MCSKCIRYILNTGSNTLFQVVREQSIAIIQATNINFTDYLLSTCCWQQGPCFSCGFWRMKFQFCGLKYQIKPRVPNVNNSQPDTTAQCLWSTDSPSGYLQTKLFLELQLSSFHLNRKWPSWSGGAEGWWYRTAHISPPHDGSSQCQFLQQIRCTCLDLHHIKNFDFSVLLYILISHSQIMATKCRYSIKPRQSLNSIFFSMSWLTVSFFD